MMRQVITRQPVMVGNTKIGDKEMVVNQPVTEVIIFYHTFAHDYSARSDVNKQFTRVQFYTLIMTDDEGLS